MMNIFLDFIIKIITFDYFVIKSILSKFIRKSSLPHQFRILDIGCGTGELASRFSPNHYLGFDIDKKSVDIAKRRNRGYKFMVADATHPPLKKYKFDLILISGVVHHLGDLDFEKVLNVIKPHLSESGRILMIEAIPPIFWWNVVGKILRKMDQGHHVRELKDYVRPTKRHFRVIDSYQQIGGLVDYGVVLAGN